MIYPARVLDRVRIQDLRQGLIRIERANDSDHEALGARKRGPR